MPGFLLHVGATLSCPHGGQISIAPGSPRAKVSGQPVATLSDTFLVTGCAFMVGPKPQPCVQVQWTGPAGRVRAGSPLLLQDSVGMCLSVEQIPAGPPRVLTSQTRVKGT